MSCCYTVIALFLFFVFLMFSSLILRCFLRTKTNNCSCNQSQLPFHHQMTNGSDSQSIGICDVVDRERMNLKMNMFVHVCVCAFIRTNLNGNVTKIKSGFYATSLILNLVFCVFFINMHKTTTTHYISSAFFYFIYLFIKKIHKRIDFRSMDFFFFVEQTIFEYSLA